MIAPTLQWIAIFFVALAAQASLMPVIAIGGITPDLVLASLFLLSLRHGMLAGVYAGFLVGVCQDIYSPVVLGQFALSKSVTGFIMGIFNDRIMRTDPLVKAALMLFLFVFHDTIFSLVDVFKHDLDMGSTLLPLLTRSIPRALYSLLVVAMVYLWRHFISPSPLRR